jgi:hypothetical protein
MPKIIYSNWLNKGIVDLKRNNDTSALFTARGIDLHRLGTDGIGLLRPGDSPTIITKSDADPAIINDVIVDAVVDPTSVKAYLLQANGRLLQCTNITTGAFNADFDGAGHYFILPANATIGYKLLMYPVSTTINVFIAHASAASCVISTYPLTGTTITATITGLNKTTSGVDMLEWNKKLYYSHGRNIGTYDGTTADIDYFDLGQGWEISKLTSTNDYIIIGAHKTVYAGATYRTECKLFFWDGVSATVAYSIPVADNKVVNLFNDNGTIYVFTEGRNAFTIMHQVNGDRLEKIKEFKINMGSGYLYYTNPTPSSNTIDSYNNGILIGLNDATIGALFYYGSPRNDIPKVLTNPHEAGTLVYFVKNMWNIYVWVSYTIGTVKYLSKISTAGNTNAKVYTPYYEFGQNARINYIKFYYIKLENSENSTPVINIDYNDSDISLKDAKGNTNIQDATGKDSGTTYKKFMVGRNCHSFRWGIGYASGPLKITKVVVDFSYLPD